MPEPSPKFHVHFVSVPELATELSLKLIAFVTQVGDDGLKSATGNALTVTVLVNGADWQPTAEVTVNVTV